MCFVTFKNHTNWKIRNFMAHFGLSSVPTFRTASGIQVCFQPFLLCDCFNILTEKRNQNEQTDFWNRKLTLKTKVGDSWSNLFQSFQMFFGDLFFGKNLHHIGCATVFSKCEVTLTDSRQNTNTHRQKI